MRKTLLHHHGAVNSRSTKYAGSDDDAGFKNSHFDEHESTERISKLFQIHCTLEHLLMMHIHLNLANGKKDKKQILGFLAITPFLTYSLQRCLF